MESLAKVDLPAREFRVLFAICRQTIGYQVEAKRLTADEIGALTNMRRDVVSKAISHLLERRILFRIGEAAVSWAFLPPANGHFTIRRKNVSVRPNHLTRTM